MDYIHGESLSHLFKLSARAKVPMSRRVLTTIMVGVLTGLDAAHEARNEAGDALEIVHRDVSPQNVLLGLDGVPRVLDFGVAKAALRVHWSTQSGQIKGKLGYMSPEQLTTGLVDRRADIYSAGVILWEGLTGRRMFDPKTAPDVGVIVGRILSGTIEPPSNIVPTTPKVLDAIVLKALSRSREDRYATAREMAVALERAQAPLPSRQVGEWVAQVAGEGLKVRAAELTQIERVELPRPTRSSSDYPAVHQAIRAEKEESGSISVPGLPSTDEPPPIPPSRRALASGQDLRLLMPTPPPVQPTFDVEMPSDPPNPASEAETNPPPAGPSPSPQAKSSPDAETKAPPAAAEAKATAPDEAKPAAADSKPKPAVEVKPSPTPDAKPLPGPPVVKARIASPPRPVAPAKPGAAEAKAVEKPGAPQAPPIPAAAGSKPQLVGAPPAPTGTTSAKAPPPVPVRTVPVSPSPEGSSAAGSVEKAKGIIPGAQTVIGFAALEGDAAAVAKADAKARPAVRSIDGSPPIDEPKAPAAGKQTIVGMPVPSAAAPAEAAAVQPPKPAEPKTEPEPDEPTRQATTYASAVDAQPVPAPSIPPGEDALPMAPRRLVWAAGVACSALLVVTVWVMASRNKGGASPTDTTPVTSETATATATSTASTTASVSTPEPPTTPAVPADTATPSQSASPTPAQPEPANNAAAVATSSAPVHPHPTSSPSRKANCNPPFTTDSQGVRIPKRECFR
jgi:serine/threonine-protein kinase